MELSAKNAELTAAQFQKEIFRQKANVSAPIIMHDERCDRIQNYYTFKEIFDSHLQNWYQNVVLLGAARYSLINEVPVNILSRISINFRKVELPEIVCDIQQCFNQILGPELTQEERTSGNFGILIYESQKFHHYVTPPRIKETIFTTCSFQGNDLKDISKILTAAEQIDPVGNFFQTNQLWHCESGDISRVVFNEIKNYDYKKMKYIGRIINEENKIWYNSASSDNIYDITILSHEKIN